MKNKKIIISSLLVVIILSLVTVFFIKVQSSLQCAKEGETTGSAGMPNSCCSGLRSMGGWPGGYNGDCTLGPPPTGLAICTKCGDNKCDAYNGENKCNCPEDCK